MAKDLTIYQGSTATVTLPKAGLSVGGGAFARFRVVPELGAAAAAEWDTTGALVINGDAVELAYDGALDGVRTGVYLGQVTAVVAGVTFKSDWFHVPVKACA